MRVFPECTVRGLRQSYLPKSGILMLVPDIPYILTLLHKIHSGFLLLPRVCGLSALLLLRSILGKGR